MMVGKWVKQFTVGRTDVHDLQHSGWPSDSMLFDNVQHLYNLLEDGHMTILESCFHLQTIDCGRSSVRKIIHNVLGFWKLMNRWVLHLLTNKHMKNQIVAALSFLLAYERGVGQICWIIMGDEAYVHYYTPMSKRQRMVWWNLVSLHWRRAR